MSAEPVAEDRQALGVLAAQVEEHLGVLGDHVGSLAATRHHAVHAVGRRHLLAVHRDPGVHQVYGVQRVATHERLRRRVRGDPGERGPQLAPAEEHLVGDVVGEGVHHERGVDVVERAVPRHQLLAGPALLGGSAEPDHSARQPVLHPREREEGSHPGHRDDVVAAGVADARQRVVLRQDRDRGAVGAADLRAERRLHAVRGAGHGDPLRLDEVGEHGGGPVFLERDLGVRGQVVRPGEERVLEVGDGRAHVVEQFLGCAFGVRGRRGRRRGTRLGLLAETPQQEWVDSARALRHVRLRFHGPSRQLSLRR